MNKCFQMPPKPPEPIDFGCTCLFKTSPFILLVMVFTLNFLVLIKITKVHIQVQLLALSFNLSPCIPRFWSAGHMWNHAFNSPLWNCSLTFLFVLFTPRWPVKNVSWQYFLTIHEHSKCSSCSNLLYIFAPVKQKSCWSAMKSLEGVKVYSNTSGIMHHKMFLICNWIFKCDEKSF